VGVGSWIGGEVQLQLGLESRVVVDGFDKSGENVIGRDGVLEKSKFGNVDLIVGKVGGEVGWVHKPFTPLKTRRVLTPVSLNQQVLPLSIAKTKFCSAALQAQLTATLTHVKIKESELSKKARETSNGFQLPC
jgi:hypothetical protein